MYHSFGFPQSHNQPSTPALMSTLSSHIPPPPFFKQLARSDQNGLGFPAETVRDWYSKGCSSPAIHVPWCSGIQVNQGSWIPHYSLWQRKGDTGRVMSSFLSSLLFFLISFPPDLLLFDWFWLGFSRQDFFAWPWLPQNPLCRLGWPWPQTSTAPASPELGLKVHHHCQAIISVCKCTVQQC